MKYIFGTLAAICYVMAFFGCMAAKTSIHEIQGGIVVIVGTLFAIGAGIIDSIDSLSTKLRIHINPQAPPTPETHVRCPECRELVHHTARKCPHCNTDLKPSESPPVIRAK